MLQDKGSAIPDAMLELASLLMKAAVNEKSNNVRLRALAARLEDEVRKLVTLQTLELMQKMSNVLIPCLLRGLETSHNALLLYWEVAYQNRAAFIVCCSL